jgi:flavin reductase (DIM6/NTAB) family NADH-FMN oxidoreductase RutF
VSVMDKTIGEAGVTPKTSSNAFRSTMQYLCGAVAVISTEYAGRDVGMTATAVCSISDTPPTVMVCINKSASIHHPLSEAGRYTISILGASNTAIAQKFSSKDENIRRERTEHFIGASGRRYVSAALAVMHCSIVREVDCGTHTAFFAEVAASHVYAPEAGPLLYFRKTFHNLTEKQAVYKPQTQC